MGLEMDLRYRTVTDTDHFGYTAEWANVEACCCVETGGT